jgi:hypothetical protein
MSMETVFNRLNAAVELFRQRVTDGQLKNKQLRIKIFGLEVDSIKRFSDGTFEIHGVLENAKNEAVVYCDSFVPMLVIEPSKEDRPAIGFRMESLDK